MKKNVYSLMLMSLAIVTPVVFVANEAFSQDPATEEVTDIEKNFPKSGVIAATKQSGRNASVEGFGGVAFSEKDKAPISGSVSQVDKTKWIAKVFNNSQETISGSFSVKQTNKSGNATGSDSFSTTLQPGQSVERPITTSPSTVNAELSVTNWRVLGKKKADNAKIK